MTEIEQTKESILRSKGAIAIMTEVDILQYFLTTIESQNSQIESLKAITELAVKGLAMELNLAIATQNRYGITRLDTILSEIEKLQK